MDMAEAHARMMCLGIMSPSLLKRCFPIEYEKLCYAIGHDLDTTTLTTPWYSRSYVSMARLLNEITEIGKRYQALQSATVNDI
jgi:hypothetical protein